MEKNKKNQTSGKKQTFLATKKFSEKTTDVLKRYRQGLEKCRTYSQSIMPKEYKKVK